MPKSLHFLFSALIALATPCLVLADAEYEIRSILRGANIGKTKVAVSIDDLSANRSIMRVNADEPMIPASNLKLVVSAAALATLGPDFHFETKLVWYNAPLKANDPDTRGRAILKIIGDGDPAFGDDAVLRAHGNQVADAEALVQVWVDAVKQAGITRIDTILIDDSVFDQEFVHESWPEDQLNRWYCAQVAGLNFFTNCLDIYPVPSSVQGDSPFVRMLPETNAVTTTNVAVTGNADTFWISRKLGTNELTYRGTVKHKRLKPVNVTVHDAPILFGKIFAERLFKAGIAVGEVRRPNSEDPLLEGKDLHIVRTPISIVLNRCNKNSQNLYAECLFKRTGRKVTGASGSFENGAAGVRLFLQKQIGTAAASVQTADGSGMSRKNSVTARVITDLLGVMHNDPKLSKVYRDSLATAGIDGTIDDRMVELKGRVFGKTGYINGVSCLSGYLFIPNNPRGTGANSAADAELDPKDCRVIAFSLLFNDFSPSLSVLQKLQDDIVRKLDQELRPR